jgi:YVTN family beta-propeller protein
MRRPAATLLVAIAAIGCGAALAKPKPKPKLTPNPGAIVKSTIRTGLQPCGEVEAAGAVWISTYLSSTLERINPATNKVTGKVAVGDKPCGLVAGFDSIWINAYGTNSVERVDPRTLKLTAHIPVGKAPFDVLVAAGSVWTTNNGDGSVSRIDPATNQVTSTIRIGAGAAGLAFAGGAVWVGATGPAEDVFRIDPATEAVTRVPIGEPGPVWFSSRGDELWVSTLRNNVVRIDAATNRVTARVGVGLGPKDGVLDSRGLIWTPNLNANSVSIVDAATASLVTTIRVGESPFVLNDGFGDVWSASYGGGDVRRLRAPKIVTSTLAEHNGSGQSGTVRLIAVSRTRTLVAVTLTSPPDARQPVHLHGGRCGSFTGLPFGEWMLRGGRGAKVVPAAISKLSNSRYALDVHRAAGDPSYVACANLR